MNSTSTTTSLRQHQSPQQYLISTMVQSTSDEMIQLINQEVEKNVTLEVEDPREVSLDAPASMPEDEDTDPGSVIDAPSSKIDAEQDGDSVSFFDNDDDGPSDRIGTKRMSDPDDDFNPGSAAVSEDTFRENLKQQISMLDITDEERYLAQYIIDSLDDDGYLRRPLEELVDDLEFTQHHLTTSEDLEAVLVEIVQEELEPSGIGACDLRECMLLQLLDRKGTPAARVAYAIVDQAFDDLSQKRYDRIEQGFGITNHQLLVDALRIIRHLNPKPGNMQPLTSKSAESRVQQLRPDFSVHADPESNGHLIVMLNDGQIPTVRISAEQEAQYEFLQRRSESFGTSSKNLSPRELNERNESAEGARFLREHLQNGRNFIDALRTRHTTLTDVMQTIVNLQRPYFLTGQIETLKPMTLQDVADRCSYDISTISRVSNSKYIDTDFGIISVKDLFTNAVADSNQAAVLEALRSVIDAEDKHHPLSDEALVSCMAEAGYPIARRTVAKYREMLGVPVARLRREV